MPASGAASGRATAMEAEAREAMVTRMTENCMVADLRGGKVVWCVEVEGEDAVMRSEC